MASVVRRASADSDWKSKLTTFVRHRAVRRFCTSAPGPVPRFFRIFGLQVSPSPRRNRGTRLAFRTIALRCGRASRCQTTFHRPHAGSLPATSRRSERNRHSSTLPTGRASRNADRFCPKILHAGRSDAPNFSTVTPTTRRGPGLSSSLATSLVHELPPHRATVW